LNNRRLLIAVHLPQAYTQLGPCALRPLPRQLRLHGRHAIRVFPADAPQDIAWANLLPPAQRPWLVMRRLATLVLIAGLLVCSYAAVQEATGRSRLLRSQYPPVDCSAYSIDIDGRHTPDTPWDRVLTKTDVQRDHWWAAYGNGTTGGKGLERCFCQGLYEQVGVRRALRYAFSGPGGQTAYLCWDYAKRALERNSMLIGSAVVVVAINFLLRVGDSLPTRSSTSTCMDGAVHLLRSTHPSADCQPPLMHTTGLA
jgi:hypothetical protein